MSTSLSQSPIAAALFGKARIQVLALLYGRPANSFYLREIGRLTGSSVGTLQRELTRLTGAGLVRRELRGRQVYYQADRTSPVFNELRGLVLKTAGVADVIRGAFGGLGDCIEVAFIYGSFATGRPQGTSDVDLMVIGDATFPEVVSAVASAQEAVGREINPTVYPIQEFREKLRQDNHFLRSVLAGPKLFLMGSQRELARLAR
jgi:DNA-binding transcriptional ArsR family regulator/predicted nucleotidyltransferase